MIGQTALTALHTYPKAFIAAVVASETTGTVFRRKASSEV